MDEAHGAPLLRLARQAIEASFIHEPVAIPPEPWLREPAAVFVSLHRRDGELRGCIGTIEARQPLGEAVVEAAQGAAFRDSRFRPLTAAELPPLLIEISVLSPMSRLPVASEADACARLSRTRPGVLLQAGPRRAVFLPKVWESIADAREFLQHLRIKAGLPATVWPDTIELSVFTCDEFAEPEDAPVRVEA
jgi:AmmeMemoRadiSam system protein A